MNTIRTQTVMQHVELNVTLSSNLSRATGNEALKLISMEVGADNVEADPGEVRSPSQAVVRLKEGDDLLVGFTSTGHQMRLTGPDDSVLLRLDVVGRRDTNSFTTRADSGGDLLAKHFFVFNYTPQKLAVWFRADAVAASNSFDITNLLAGDTFSVAGTTFTYTTGSPAAGEFTNVAGLAALIDELVTVTAAVNLDGLVVVTAVTPGTGGNSIAIEIGGSNTGDATITTAGGFLVGGLAATAEPTVSGALLVPATIVRNASADTVASAVVTALAANEFVSVSAVGSRLTVTDRNTGARSAAGVGDSAFTAFNHDVTGAASPVINLKSVGTSQALVMFLPL